MNDFIMEGIIALLTDLINLAIILAIGKYLIRYAARVFAEEFRKREP